MRIVFAFLIILMPLIVRAANPAFTDFSTNAFAVTGNKVVNKYWTNAFTTDMEGSPVLIILSKVPSGIQFATNNLNNLVGTPSSTISIGYPGTNFTQIAQSNAYTLILGDMNFVGNGTTLTFGQENSFVGHFHGFGAYITNLLYSGAYGTDGFQSSRITNAESAYSFGMFNLANGHYTDLLRVFGVGRQNFQAGSYYKLSDCFGLGVANFQGSDMYVTNLTFAYAFGNSEFSESSITNSRILFGLGTFGFSNSKLSGVDSLYGIGNQVGNMARLTRCTNLFFIGNDSGTNLVLTAKTNIIVLGNLHRAVPNDNEIWLGNSNNIARIPGQLAIDSGITNNGALTNAGAASFGTNQTTFATNESRSIVVRPRTNHLEAVNPQTVYQIVNPDPTVNLNFEHTVEYHPQALGGRTNVVFLEGVGTRTVGSTGEIHFYEAIETAFHPATRMIEWYYQYGDTNGGTDRFFGMTYPASNVANARVDFIIPELHFSSSDINFENKAQTKVFAEMNEGGGFDSGGVTILYGVLELRPFSAGGALPSWMIFHNDNSTAQTLVSQVGNNFVVRRAVGAGPFNAFFENYHALTVSNVFLGNGFELSLSRVAAGNLAVGNGTAGNIAGSITTSNANFAGTVSITNALKVGLVNAASLTNVLYGSATLNFPDTSVGAVSDLAITVTGAADGDIVSVGAPTTATTTIVGSYSGFASNDTVFVRFTPTAASQNPNSGTFKVMVHKFQ